VLQKQPNEWSCLPTAFAIATGIPVADLIKAIGHDGSEIVFSGSKPWRSFNPQEVIIALLCQGWAVTAIEKQIEIVNQSGENRILEWDLEPIRKQFPCVVGGTINGNRHAAYWNGDAYEDPNGTIHKNNFDVEIIWICERRSCNAHQRQISKDVSCGLGNTP
jgi:hypothetical protein